MVGERLAGDKTEVELLVGVLQVGRPTHMPTVRPPLGVPTRKRPTLTKVERHRHGIPRPGRPIPTAMVVGHLDGTRAREHQIPTVKEDAPQVGMQVRGRPTRIPAQVRMRTLLVQARVGVNLRAVPLQAGNNHREMLLRAGNNHLEMPIMMVGVVQQPRTSGSVWLTSLVDLC